LQGIKRGVMELCDGVLVHKADGELAAAAERAAAQCQQALAVLHAGAATRPPVLLGSSRTGRGLDELWQTIERAVAGARSSGALDRRRAQQREQWLDAVLRQRLLEAFFAAPQVQQALPGLRAAVAAGTELPPVAARALLALRAQP